jgi:hypothetical protein
VRRFPSASCRKSTRAFLLVYKKTALDQTVQQYDFPDKNFINRVYTHRLNELFAETAPAVDRDTGFGRAVRRINRTCSELKVPLECVKVS